MAITAIVLDANENLTATGAYNTLSVTIPENKWALVAVATQGNGATHAVSGTGLTGASAPSVIKHGVFDTNKSMSWHKILGPAGGFTGVLTITPSAGISQGHWCVIETNLSGPDDPVVQAPNIVAGAGTTFGPVALAAARSAASRSFAIGSHNVFQALAAGSGMTELTDQPGNSGPQSFEVCWSNAAFEANPTVVAATSGNYGILAIEIDEPVPAPPGGILPQVWDGAVWITADAVWTWDGAAWVAGTLHAYDGVDWQ
jgi:hypothetical protein